MVDEPRGFLVLSIEVQAGANQTALAQHRGLNHVAKQLVTLLNERLLPATWGVPQPSHSAVTDDVVGSRVAHEIAILGDGSWIGREVSYEITDRELDARIHSARERSLLVSSLVLSGTDLPSQIGRLRQKGITAVRGPMYRRAWRRHNPVGKCDGIYYRTPAASVPARANWLSLEIDVLRGRRIVRRLVERGGLAHVAIRANHLIDRHDSGTRLIAHFLDDCRQGVESGNLRAVTLAEASSRFAMASSSKPMRSILRPAA